MKDNKYIVKGEHSYYDGSLQLKRYGNRKNKLYIGKFCSISLGLKVFLGGNHRYDWVTTYPFNVLWDSAKHISGHPKSNGDVIIQNDVWVGENCTIMSGINIGSGSVIATNSVVTNNIDPYSIVGGNPAKLIKYRFSDEQIEELLKIKWWNWDNKKIRRNVSFLLSTDINTFIEGVNDGTII